MKRCASCGREIPESATVCEACDKWATDHLAAPPPPPATAPAPAPSRAVATAPAAGLSRKELLLIAGGVAVAGIVTLALLSARGVQTPAVAAANVTTATRRVEAPPAPVPVQTWNTERRAYWTGNRRKSAAFELPAENSVSIWLGQVRPLLVVRCIDKRTEAFVFTGSALRIEAGTEDHTVTYRIGDEAERTERWPDSAEHDALFAPDGAAFAQHLLEASAFRFGYNPHNASPAVASFHVSGLRELIEPVARECGWKQ